MFSPQICVICLPRPYGSLFLRDPCPFPFISSPCFSITTPPPSHLNLIPPHHTMTLPLTSSTISIFSASRGDLLCPLQAKHGLPLSMSRPPPEPPPSNFEKLQKIDAFFNVATPSLLALIRPSPKPPWWFHDRIVGRSNGDVAIDSYHRYKEDVAMMKDIGFNAYRFSISWSRLLPRGNLKGGINQEGVIYYNNLINELISSGQTPFITLFHSDLPQALEDEYGGFLSPKIEQDFADYAEVCFREFGDRVKHWITLNEPLLYSTQGYGSGSSPPMRCSKSVANCNAGDSSTEPYVVTHHLILSHAAAVKVYRKKFQNTQKGQIGVTLNSAWLVPLSQSKEDREATSRGLAFMYDWFMEPLHSGTYPAVIVNKVKERLPKFSRSQFLMVKGSYDFVGLNYYTSTYAANIPCPRGKSNVFTDNCVRFTTLRNGVLIGPKAASDWLYIYPPGIQGLLEYTKEKFSNPIIYITENGVDEVDDGKRSLDDKPRIDYISHHLFYLQRAVMNGVRVKGYFAWSLLDNFEWNAGYTLRFGLVYVDYKNGLRRYRKRSALWFKLFLRK